MNHYKELLVAVDFSEPSIRVLQVARELGGRINARLNIVHFVPFQTIGLDMEGMELEASYIEELHQKDLEKATEKLEVLIKDHATKEDDIVHHVFSGEPETGINPKAVEIGAGMIIIGTHGRTGLKHLFMGSVAESVLKSADIPVLCIRTS